MKMPNPFELGLKLLLPALESTLQSEEAQKAFIELVGHLRNGGRSLAAYIEASARQADALNRLLENQAQISLRLDRLEQAAHIPGRNLLAWDNPTRESTEAHVARGRAMDPPHLNGENHGTDAD